MKTILAIAIVLFSWQLFAQITPTLDWGYSTGTGGDQDLYYKVLTTPQNEVLISGYSIGAIDMDFGPGVQEIGSWSNSAHYFANYDPSGALNWVVHYDNFPGYFGDIHLDDAGNIYVMGSTGTTSSGYDYDPGPGISNVVLDPGGQFILKLDPLGNFMYIHLLAQGVNTTSGDQFRCETLDVDDSGDIVIGGFFDGEFDMNPGGAPALVNSGGEIHGLVQKYDANGNYLWHHSYGKAWVKDVVFDNTNEILVGGYVKDSIDFDFGPGVDMHVVDQYDSTSAFIQKLDAAGNSQWSRTYSSDEWNHVSDIVVSDSGNIYLASIEGNYLYSGDMFVRRLDGAGTLVWEREIDGLGYESLSKVFGMQTDDLGNLYVGGRFLGIADFDPNPFSMHLDTSTANFGDNFVLKLNAAGYFLWEFSVPAYPKNLGSQDVFALDSNYNVYCYSPFDDVIDIDPGSGVTNLTNQNWGVDIYLARYSQGLCSNMYTEVDSAASVACSDPGWIETTTYDGLAPYTYAWNNTPPSDSANAVILDHGIYQLETTDALGCMTSRSILINGPSAFGGYDLTINAVNTIAVIGQGMTFWIDAFNDGCTPQDGEVTFVLPNDFVGPYNFNPAPTQINGDTIIWDFPSSTYDDPHFEITVMGNVDSMAVYGNDMCYVVSIMPDSTDVNYNNNSKGYCEEIRSSYDPNYKEVYPAGECEEHFVELDQKLTYTVHFQNTGTFQAYDVRIHDKIDTNLDVSSIRILAQSDPLYIDVLPNNEIDFVFDDIHLPDSSSNEPESHGWVVFEIDPLPGIPSNTLVENKVEIYFDFNAPIITNTVFNTYIDIIPSCFLGMEENNEDVFQVYPNPSSGTFKVAFESSVSNAQLTIFTTEGKEVMQLSNQSGSQFEIDLSNQPEGMYWLQVSGDVNGTKKLMLK